MAKLLVLLAIVGVAYWYWWGRPAEPIELREADRLRENAAIMQSCVKREQSMTAAGSVGGLADAGYGDEDAQRLCAEKNRLYLRDGSWYNKRD
jgi:hypothetical protein